MIEPLPAGRVDVVAVGETMAVLLPAKPGPLEDVASFTPSIGGAESNVAVHLARRAHTAAWVGAVGDDGFGRLITRRLAAEGVDVSGVRVDRDRLTGLYLKEITESGTRVCYYRAGSAATALGPADAGTVSRLEPRVVHTSGITAVLSDSSRQLVEALLRLDARSSFDVNYRPALHRPEHGSLLLELARAADLVFVGEDEAEAVWGTRDADTVRALLPGVPLVVVKQGADGATGYAGADRVHVPAHRVDVVEAVGAGDAFAAGVLHGLLTYADLPTSLRHGHDLAAGVLVTTDDLGSRTQ
jgi:2-dehydro-3-deoxygluconokinase